MAEPDLMADSSVWDIPGQPSPVATIYASLNQSLGTAYDVSETSNVTAETKAAARVLAAVWRSHRRMMLQWDPRYIDLFLDRWEAIFGITHAAGDSDATRRIVLQNKFLALASKATLAATAAAIMGTSYVGIVYTTLADDVARWPEVGFPDAWSSNVSHILVRVQITGGQTEIAFLRLIGKLVTALDDLLPAWVSWDWSTYDEAGAEAFFLDEPVGAGPPPVNLGYESFDI